MKKFLALLLFSGITNIVSAQLSLGISMQSSITCNALCNGSVTVAANGGTPPYSYLWQPGNIPGQTLSNACAGSYTCTVTDAVMATATLVVVLNSPPALAATTTFTPNTCGSSGNGVAAISVTGGTGSYTYSWSPSGITTAIATGLPSGSYTCTVWDANGCSISATVNVPNIPAPAVSIPAWMNVWCFGGNNGGASAVPFSGTAPYTYLWSNADNDSILSSATAGSYTVTLTDAIGCTATQSVVITQPPLLTVGTLSPVPSSYCEGQEVSLSSGPFGGMPPYTFSASPFPSWGTNVEAHNATYTLTITDANGCTATNTIALTPGPNMLALNPVVTNAACNQSPSSIAVSPTGGSAPYTYLWTPGNITTSSISNLTPGNYFVYVEDNTGCPIDSFFTIVDSCDYVYPGDANQDGVANNLDILDIGIANGATGSLRNNATINWTPQYSFDWGQTLISGTDYKYVDCDGNGTIQPADTNAVILNFGYTHNVRLGAPVYDASVPDLSITLNQDTLGAGWRGSMNVALGDAFNPAIGVYGVAFTLSFDANMIDAATFSMNEIGSWMGIPGSNLMGVVLHEGTGTGSVQVAITRLNQVDTSGYGDIATIGFNTSNTLSGSGNSQNVNFVITNVTILSANETTQTANAIGDSVLVADAGILTATQTHVTTTLRVYPNPANEILQLQIPSGASQVVTIEDLSGRVVYLQKHVAGMNTISVADLPGGMYILRTTDVNGNSSSQKITIAH